MRLWGANALKRFAGRVAAWVSPHRRKHRPQKFSGREFGAPQLITEAVLPAAPGIYAIQMRNWWGSLKPVHFGASDNLYEELLVDGHEGFMHWLTQYGSRRGIYVSFVADADADHHRRHHEGTQLNRHYFPHRTHSLDEHLERHRVHRSAQRSGK
jgi:hypothetical protein